MMSSKKMKRIKINLHKKNQIIKKNLVSHSKSLNHELNKIKNPL